MVAREVSVYVKTKTNQNQMTTSQVTYYTWKMHYLQTTETPKKILKIVKGYLHYKTVTSQNVPSEAQVKNFFKF